MNSVTKENMEIYNTAWDRLDGEVEKAMPERQSKK